MRKNSLKRVCLLLAAALLLSLGLAACGGGSSNNSTPGGNNGGGNKEAGWVFKKGSVTVAMFDDADAVIKALGQYKSQYEAESCAFDGKDVIYSYPGYDILVFQEKDRNVISGVILRDDTVETPEHISIGSTVAEVEKAYGKFEPNTTSLRLDKGNCQLLILTDNGKVIHIQYIALVEQ